MTAGEVPDFERVALAWREIVWAAMEGRVEDLDSVEGLTSDEAALARALHQVELETVL